MIRNSGSFCREDNMEHQLGSAGGIMILVTFNVHNSSTMYFFP